ncbi:unnamed protein product [Sphagnum troendelagicum]|uniref:Morc S5 domain-containing protein n=1 Tax=Sphagnum troendelagicum TaxID=128251 RepID=A0ABP0UMA2_9BRYO
MAGVIDLVSSDDEENPGTQEGDKTPLVAEPLVSLTPGGSVDGSGGGGSSSLFHSSSGGVKNGNPEGGANGWIPKGKGTIRAADDGRSSFRDPDVCRHFWRAGDYNAPAPRRQRPAQGSMDHVRVHPKFLHSNATSHKWALGAIAELLDNAIDEIENGATYVRVDKITNPRDGNPALLIQDDGGGMGPEGIRQCMSLGYSRKNTNTTIGQYGNGFKTSTMRLGADVIVFTRNSSGRVATQSIGLLSYTFLRKAGHEDIVVPMLDYQLSASGREPTVLVRSNMDDWLSNLATLMRWSPYASEVELLKQFNDIGWHGTKVIVFNLWLNDDGILELDFDSDEHDIQLRVGSKDKPGKQVNLPTQLTQEHIVNRYRLSLRAYASILYLQMPPQFQIILRNLPVEHHSIAMDLKFCEYIVYKPQIGGNKDPINKETSVITTIGFTKEAPMVNVHGFNVYHKNRLIMPFWKVFQDNSSRGRGVVGVLEANFIEPAHDKQDFERTTVFLRLEARLKAMTIEYWNLHCHLIGYQSSADKRNRKTMLQVEIPVAIPAAVAATSSHPLSSHLPVIANQNKPQMVTSLSPSTSDSSSQGEQLPDHSSSVATNLKKINGSLSQQQHPGMPFVPASGGTLRATSNSGRVSSSNGRVTEGILEQNITLRAKCKEYEKREKDWEEKVAALERELAEHKVKYSLLQEQMRLVQAVRDNEDEVNTTQERFTMEERIPKLESEMEE